MQGKFQEVPPCSVKKMPVPQTIVCEQCAVEIEVWSDEDEKACPGCGRIIAMQAVTP